MRFYHQSWWDVWDTFTPEKQCEFLWRMWYA